MKPEQFYYATTLIALAIAHKCVDPLDESMKHLNELLYIIGDFKENKIDDKLLSRLNKLFVRYQGIIEDLSVRENTF